MNHTKTKSAFYALVFAAAGLWLFTPAAFAGDGPVATNPMPLDSAEDFVAIANNAFPGLAKRIEDPVSAKAGTGASSGQAVDPAPSNGITWQEYMDGLDALNVQIEKKEITESDWMIKTQTLRSRFLRGERDRGHGFYSKKRPYSKRPVIAREIQIEKELIQVQGGSQND